jgi:hypothetical protein
MGEASYFALLNCYYKIFWQIMLVSFYLLNQFYVKLITKLL